MDIIPDKRKVVGLVEQALEGKLCLPNFQRDFVWRRDEVADLLRSVMRRYYIGSVLLLRCDPQRPPFAPIFLRGASPPHVEPRPELLILDGQQRLTSLLYALKAPKLGLKDSRQQRFFFLDLKKLLEDPDAEEVVFERAARDLDGLDQANEQYWQRALPFPKLLSTHDFYSWRDGLEDHLREKEPDALKKYRENWRPQWDRAIQGFQTFEVPVVELPRVDEADHVQIGRVCAIFEKLNSTGVELSVYDLLTARLYRHGIRLHDLWTESAHQHKRLKDWSGGKADTNKFGVLVLRVLALLRNLDPKPRILIDLAPTNFAEDWRRAAAAMERALELVTSVSADGFGVFHPKWLPGFGLLPILAALRARIDDDHLGDEPREDLRRWYWSNVFLERYSSAVESKSRKDYVDFTRYWAGETQALPSVFNDAQVRIGAPQYTIKDSTSFASAVYSGVFCLLAIRGARDWRLRENIQLQKLDDHHIFPRSYLKRHKIERARDVNSVLNRTLISNETNKRIRDAAPAEYLDNPDIFPKGASESLLGPHFLTGDAKRKMERATEGLPAAGAAKLYADFLRARERSIIAEIRRVCGLAN